MVHSPHQRRPSAFCGKLHREAGPFFLRMLDNWERTLNYVKYRIAEWKQQASVMHPEYYSFRDYILVSVERNICTELDLLAILLAACLSIAEGPDVPQHWRSHKLFSDFREQMSTGSVTRSLHLERWREYTSTRAGKEDHEATMENMFDLVRAEIATLEQRAKDFRGMVKELKNLVDQAQNLECAHVGGGPGELTIPGVSPSRIAFLKNIEKRRPPLPGKTQASVLSASSPTFTRCHALTNPEPCKLKRMRQEARPPMPGSSGAASEIPPSTPPISALDHRMRTVLPHSDAQVHTPPIPSRPRYNGPVRFPTMISPPQEPRPISESRTRLPPHFTSSPSPSPTAIPRRPAPSPISASRSRLPPPPHYSRFSGSRTRELVERARATVAAIDDSMRHETDEVLAS
ncbi:hypothetical protein OF83DRAFT_364892 [Amylostereum chailletii]|nr:hypothetical protein OF83DRAFT_364892 [Amylostereum chailletii]